MGNDWRVRVAILAARAYYETNPTGGSLHIVLDDGNVDGEDVEFCIRWARKCGDPDGEALALMLRAMSRSQRARVADSVYRRVPVTSPDTSRWRTP